MIPFYIYYSMFGFQRVGDLAWAAGDMRSRGFLLGGTAGRTTLNGEGLQHEDGQSQMLASTIPNCVSLRSDLRLRGGGDHPGRPAAHARGAGGRLLLPHADERELPATRRCRRARQPSIIKGMYLFCGRSQEAEGAARAAAGLGHDLARGHRRRRAAARRLGRRSRPLELPVVHRARARGVAPSSAGTCSIPMRKAAPVARRRTAWRATTGPSSPPPITCARSPSRSAPYVPRRYRVLGTDGFGRSDTREKLRALLRGRPPLRHRRRAFGAGRRGHVAGVEGRRGRSRSTGSTRPSRRPGPYSSATCNHALECARQPRERAGSREDDRNGQLEVLKSRFRTSAISGRAGHRGVGEAGRRSASTIRSSRSNPTRRRWTCRRPPRGGRRARQGR